MQTLFGVLDEVEQVTDEMYKNAEMLLDLYRKVKFRVYRNLEEIDEELYIEDRKNLNISETVLVLKWKINERVLVLT